MSFEANPLIDLPVEGNMGEKLCLDGEAFAAQDDFEQADASFRDALDRDGTNPRALAGRSRCLRELCEYERAQRVLDRGLFLYPVDQRLLAEQGKLYFDQEEWDKALATFNQALDLTPTPDSWEWIIKCLCHKGPPFEEAEKAASQALSQFPTSSGVLTQRAWLFVSQKKYGAAVEAFLQAGARESLESVLKEGFVF